VWTLALEDEQHDITVLLVIGNRDSLGPEPDLICARSKIQD
jgi:hypothetical protein